MQVHGILCLLLSICLKVVFCVYCDKQSLSFSGLRKTGTRLYLSGEGFLPSCDKGYQLARPGEKIVCRNGIWTGYFPPCVVVSCQTSPPSIPNGRIKSYTGLHGSIPNYECNEFYFLALESTIQCAFGEWKGTLPICKDTRCYVQNLKHKNGVLEDRRATISGNFLNVRCSEGFIPNGMKPTCSRGEWIEQEASPCKERDCSIHGVNNGTLKEMKEHKVWKFGKFRSERKLILVEITKGGVRPAGHHLYLTCEQKHATSGSKIVNVTTTCKQGKWQPEPICLSRKK
ncbi:sushi, von Willebrand factor type A, EGF and pentraxin domain-containing protein 1-like [Argiope bruennichi]|uniref:sushi, von Willebrand factor type A, EGF and pentraxin domain-containing protein 1-like n=1 Tax=Argiope bruennichi TaxID=94029 RepID=UPI0024946224|nr:sushi, von Willebrand factor type A, EGF and pentraxin domain-containing protein 1-like [Argiope bruennichi]